MKLEVSLECAFLLVLSGETKVALRVCVEVIGVSIGLAMIVLAFPTLKAKPLVLFAGGSCLAQLHRRAVQDSLLDTNYQTHCDAYSCD